MGVVFSINGRLAGMELFRAEYLWSSYLHHIVGSYALDAMVNGARGERGTGTDEEDPRELLDAVRGARIAIFPAVGLGEDARLEEADLTGGALLLDGEVVHLAAFRRVGAGV